MKAFTIQVQRRQLVKLLLGLAGTAYLIRIVIGLTNQPQLFSVAPAGYLEFVWVMIAVSLVLLLWDIRDKFVNRS